MQKHQHVHHPAVPLLGGGVKGCSPAQFTQAQGQPVPRLVGGSTWREARWVRGKPTLQAQAHRILLFLHILVARLTVRVRSRSLAKRLLGRTRGLVTNQ